MNISHFFIDRPIFATSLVTVILGGIAISCRPRSTPTSSLPPSWCRLYRCAARGRRRHRATIEQEVNGVQEMLYMSSQTTPTAT
jgi:multidrug efflux pump subunit AcrB